MAVRYFSMFSGIGGFELGIQRGFDNGLRRQSASEDTEQRLDVYPENSRMGEQQAICIGYSEIDKYAIKVYERNFGETNNQPKDEQLQAESDKRSDNGDKLQRTTSSNRNGGHTNYGDATAINPTDLPDFDLLVGGFPCQAFSIAGKRAGFDDTRGTLFFDIARILKEKQPRHLVLENVKGLLSHDSGRTFTTIIGVLTDLGYLVEWQVLNSKDFGVPQNRERIYIVGHLRGECSGKVFPITGQGNKYTTLGESTETTVARAITGGGNSGGNHSGMTIIKQLNQPKHSNDRIYSDEGLSPTLNTMQGGNRQPFIEQEPRIRRLTPKECERLQGFPDDWTKDGVVVDAEWEKGKINYHFEPISDTQRYKMCGNAVTVNVVEAVMRGFKCL